MSVRKEFIYQKFQKELKLSEAQLTAFKQLTALVPPRVLARGFIARDLQRGASLSMISTKYGVTRKVPRYIRAKKGTESNLPSGTRPK